MDTQLVSIIIAGIRKKEIKKKLLSMHLGPSLSETLTLCSGDEYANHNETSSHQSADRVYKLAPKHRDNANQRSRPQIPSEEDDHPDCSNCGFPSHPPRKTCPAKGQTCNSCGKPNHFTSVYRNKVKVTVGIGTIRPYTAGTIEHIPPVCTTGTIEHVGPVHPPMSRSKPTRKVVILNSKKTN